MSTRELTHAEHDSNYSRVQYIYVCILYMLGIYSRVYIYYCCIVEHLSVYVVYVYVTSRKKGWHFLSPPCATDTKHTGHLICFVIYMLCVCVCEYVTSPHFHAYIYLIHICMNVNRECMYETDVVCGFLTRLIVGARVHTI